MDSGIILLNKKPGITSFDSLRDIKRALKTGKVGHTGTLDKFARGLLVVLVGRSLKLSQWFSHCDKKYTGRIKFSAETDTLDPEGSVIAQASLPSLNDVERVLDQFTGDISQAPPAYSAIHIDGQRASRLVRCGKIPEMKKRPVTVYKLELLSWNPPFADIFVHCSSGTYIRSLARDIALAVESRAHLSMLERTQIAGFELGNDEHLRPIDKSVITLLGMPWLEVSKRETEHIFHGKALESVLNGKPVFNCDTRIRESRQAVSQQAAVGVFCGEMLVAVVEKDNEIWKYGCVLNMY